MGYRCSYVLISRFLFTLVIFFTAFVGNANEMKRPTVALGWARHYHEFDKLEEDSSIITMTKGSQVVRFFGNSRKMEFNDTVIWLSEPVSRRWGRWRIVKTDLDKTILPLLKPEKYLVRENQVVVVLDAGHGGVDKGVTSSWNELSEKDITLYIALKTGKILESAGVTTRMTRSGDDRLTLEERCALADSYGASLFVSIHLNGATNLAASGVETHVLPPVGSPVTASEQSLSERDFIEFNGNKHDNANIILGYFLQKNLVMQSKGIDRGVRLSRFHVLRNVICPAALVECGFLSNREDAENFLEPAYCDAMAGALADGIMSYLNAVKKIRQ